jgi:hypothetical protein
MLPMWVLVYPKGFTGKKKKKKREKAGKTIENWSCRRKQMNLFF